MTCKVRETLTDGTEVALFRDGKKWVGVYAWNRGGCLFATTVKMRCLETGRYREISTGSMVTEQVGDAGRYYASLWEKHVGSQPIAA